LERVKRFLVTHNGQRLVIVSFTLVAVLVLLAFPGGIAAYAVGIPLMFLVPGFALVRLFFWREESFETKFVLSIGLSVLVVVFLVLLLVLSPIGLAPGTSRASLAVFVLTAVAVERFVLKADRIGQPKPTPQEKPEPPAKLDKVVAAMLVAALAVSVVSLGLIASAEYPSRTYFAITDDEGKVITNTSYEGGTNLTFIIHMKNGEDGVRNFTLLVYASDTFVFPTQTYTKDVARGETWEKAVAINLTEAGLFRLDFDLYIQEDGSAPQLYGNLHLWIDVWIEEGG
jgi:uncharacterized membrane protein